MQKLQEIANNLQQFNHNGILHYLTFCDNAPIMSKGRTEKQGLFNLAREVWSARFALGLTGETLLSALDELRYFEGPNEQLAFYLRCCGVDSRGKNLDKWHSSLMKRRDRWAQYVQNTKAAGPLTRPSEEGYSVILADPPWEFSDQGTRMSPAHESDQRARAHYATLPTPEIQALPVASIAADNALLFLWIPGALVAQGVHVDVCKAWGFPPKNIITWIKTARNGQPRIGGGHYTRSVSEDLIVAARTPELDPEHDRLVVASRGRGASLVRDRSIPNIIVAERQDHSAKPDAQYTLIETLAGNVPRIELFARQERDGWDRWGLEA